RPLRQRDGRGGARGVRGSGPARGHPAGARVRPRDRLAPQGGPEARAGHGGRREPLGPRRQGRGRGAPRDGTDGTVDMRRAGAAGRAADAEPPGPIPLRSTALDLALITVAWWAFVAFASGGGPAVGYDSFRDIGYAHGIASGHPWEDPMIPGLPAWYPP